MNFEKAIHILNLNPNFTEEELKKAYIKLTKKYHPDKWEGTDEYNDNLRKQQELNEARESLREYLKHKVTNANNAKKEFNINDYAKEKLNSLKKRIEDDGTFSSDEEFKILFKKIDEEIYSFETDAISSYTTTKEGVDRLYAYCMKKIREKLEDYITSFYQKHYIDESEVKEKINYDCNLKSIYNQLLEIKEKYGKEEKLKKRLEEEIEKYRNYAGYIELKTIIHLCKTSTLSSIKKNHFKNIEDEINQMHQTIKTMFETYYSIKAKISKLATIISSIEDESIKNDYLKLCDNFKLGASFGDTEKSIENLEKRIFEYQEMELKKQKQKEKEHEINLIYQTLIARYTEALKSYNIVTNSEEIKKLNEFLREVVQVFIEGIKEFADLEYFKIFENITFENISNDKKVLQNNEKTLKTNKSNKSNVYIKTRDIYIHDAQSFFYLDEENMIMYKCENMDTSSKKITKEELSTEYIPIEQVIESAVFAGKYKRMLTSIPFKYLYETDKIAIFYHNERFKVNLKSIMIAAETVKPADDSFEPLQNKQYVCKMIENQVKQQVEEFKKKGFETSHTFSPNKNIYGSTSFNTENDFYDESNNRRRR